MRYRSVSRVFALGLCCSMVLGAACNEPDRAAVVNDTDQQIEIVIVSDQPTRNNLLVMTLDPGGSLSLSGQFFGECTAESLLARTAGGDDIERRGPGMCEGDVWRVNGNPAD